MLIVATMLAGYYNANAGLYRFAAIELVDAGVKERAISWVLAGGILGGVLGPNLARGRATCCRAVHRRLCRACSAWRSGLAGRSRPSTSRRCTAEQPAAPGRPLRELAAQPVFIVALVAVAHWVMA